MPTLTANDTQTLLREYAEAAEALNAAMALVRAGADAAPVLTQLSKAYASTDYGRQWLLRMPGLIVAARAEPVQMLAAAE